MEDKVTVQISFENLQRLCIWAEFWATANREKYPHMVKEFYSIADELQMQLLDRPGLSLMSQISDLRGQGYQIEVHDSVGEIELPR